MVTHGILNINLGIQQKYNLKDDYNCFGHRFILWGPQCKSAAHSEYSSGHLEQERTEFGGKNPDDWKLNKLVYISLKCCYFL